MSILIKDMEMPKDCATCHFCHTENFRAWCCITDEDIEITNMTAVQEDCPLSEAPEPCEDAVSRKAVIDLYKRGAEIIAKAKGISVEDMPHNGLDALMNLPPVTPELCEDAVSRQAVLDLIADYDLSMGQVVRGIHALPSVTPKRKTGKWIDQKGGGCCCSECGRYALDEVDGNFIHVAAKSNFCPNCGADMRCETE